MATFRKRSGRWQARIQRRGSAPQTKTFSTRTDAERWARAVERGIDTGDMPAVQRPKGTLRELLERYRRQVSPTKRGGDQEAIRLLAMSRRPIAACDIAQLTAADVAAYRDMR